MNNRIRYLKLRLLIDDLYSIVRGWYFHFSNNKADHPDLSGMHQLSECTLKINWREELKEINHSRIHNMSLGCSLINNLIIRPGQTFSLKQFLGDTSEEMGFQSGPMVVQGKVQYINGGGLCLVSTALFDAALKAGLKILEKHNHSTDLWGSDRFIGLGRDATYVYGLKDLKFMNDSKNDILIQMSVDKPDLQLHCAFLASQPSDKSIEIDTVILKKLTYREKHPTVSGQGKKSIDGWVVLTRRYTSLDNKKKTDYIKKEKYKPFKV